MPGESMAHKVISNVSARLKFLHRKNIYLIPNLVITFIINQAKEFQILTSVITFGQPLWLKATEIVHAKSLKAVLIPWRISFNEFSWQYQECNDWLRNF